MNSQPRLWIVWALGLRIVAADLVQWYCRRKGVLCVFPDTNIYWGLAGTLVRGEPYAVTYYGDLSHFALRTPGYPLFLAACRFAFGPRLLPVRLIQAALGAWCVWLAATLVRRALPESFDRARLATIAALIAAFDPFVVANSALVLSEALFLPLMLLAQLGWARLWGEGDEDRGAIGWALLTGAATAAAVLVRPSWLLYLPAMLGLWAVFGGPTARRRGPLVLLGFVVVMAPWWVRNERVYGRFVPSALWGGASLYDGLNPRATGASDMRFLADPEFWPLDEETQDAVLHARALSFARAHPARVLHLALIKAARFWSPWPNAETVFSPGLALLSALITVPQFILMGRGVWNLRRDPRALILLALPLLYTFALHLVFVSSMRYRIPVFVPALGLVAAGLRKMTGDRT